MHRGMDNDGVPEVGLVARLCGLGALAFAGQTRRLHRQEREGTVKYSIATVLIGLFVAWTPAAAFAQAKLTVEVKNQTAGGTAVAGDEVVLQVYRAQEPIMSLQAKAGADGKAVFEKVLTGPNMAAVATAKHQNMAFRSEPVALNPALSDFSAG